MTGLGPHSEVPTFVTAGPTCPRLMLRCLWRPLYGQLTLGEASGAFHSTAAAPQDRTRGHIPAMDKSSARVVR
jgi:hypothetical protein